MLRIIFLFLPESLHLFQKSGNILALFLFRLSRETDTIEILKFYLFHNQMLQKALYLWQILLYPRVHLSSLQHHSSLKFA